MTEDRSESLPRDAGLGCPLPASLVDSHEPVGEPTRGSTAVRLRLRAREGGEELLLRRLHAGPDRRARVRAEVAALQELALPGLAAIRRGGEDETGAWVLEEWVEGPSLAEVDDPGPIRGMEAVAETLRVLHAAGRVHGDVRPGNVRVTPEGRVVLVGAVLGVDPRAPAPGSAEGPEGPFLFFSPQLWLRKACGMESDWFAWAVSLYWLCEGRLPFLAEELRQGGIHQKLARPSFDRIPTGEALAGLLLGLLAYVPQDRAPHIERVFEVLARTEEVDPPPVRDPVPQVTFPPPRRTRPRVPRPSCSPRGRGRMLRWLALLLSALALAGILGWLASQVLARQ